MQNIAIFGTKTSFHERAAYIFCGKNIVTLECNSFEEICISVQNNTARYAVMAVENTIVGILHSNIDLILQFNLETIGEQILPIDLHLMANNELKKSDIEYIYTHPVALKQCKNFLEKHPQIKIIEKNDTATCAKEIAEYKPQNTAAIANEASAKLYGLNILETIISEKENISTRFLILEKGRQTLHNIR